MKVYSICASDRGAIELGQRPSKPHGQRTQPDMSKPRIEPKILDAAIELFGKYGAYGVTFHDLARRAKVTSASIYRIFGTRERLFEQAVMTASGRAIGPSNFLLTIFTAAEGQDFPATVAAAVRQWYGSLSQTDARLLMQATMMGEKRYNAEGPVEGVVKVLAVSMEREWKTKPKVGLDPAAASRALIYSLFQLKLSLPPSVSGREEQDAMEKILGFWLRAVEKNL